MIEIATQETKARTNGNCKPMSSHQEKKNLLDLKYIKFIRKTSKKVAIAMQTQEYQYYVDNTTVPSHLCNKVYMYFQGSRKPSKYVKTST